MSSSSTTTMFNFEVNKKQFFFKNLTDNILINLEKITESVAILYFTDTLNEQSIIDIPEGLKVYTYDMNNQKIEENPLKHTQKYALCFTDKHLIVYNNLIVLKIEPVRSWKISP